MTTINSILDKIEIIETTLRALKEEVISLQEAKKGKVKNKCLPDESILKAEYEALYRGFIEEKTDVINEFITSKSKPYLIAFFRANSLPIDLKRISKETASAELRNWLAQRKAITAPMIVKKPQL
jgi:hypothetical protein